jgi:seryl-tRNA synthetase
MAESDKLMKTKQKLKGKKKASSMALTAAVETARKEAKMAAAKVEEAKAEFKQARKELKHAKKALKKARTHSETKPPPGRRRKRRQRNALRPRRSRRASPGRRLKFPPSNVSRSSQPELAAMLPESSRRGRGCRG